MIKTISDFSLFQREARITTSSNMKSYIILCIVLICCMCLAYAAPVDNSNLVQFVKYNNDKEFEDIQKHIIAQYDQLGGSSQFHPIQNVHYVDPHNIKINL